MALHSTCFYLTLPASTSLCPLLPHSARFYLTLPASTSLYLLLPHSALLYLTLPASTSLCLLLPHSACFYLTLPCSNWFQLPSTMVLPWLYLILPCLSYEIHFNNCSHSPSASSSSPPQTAPLQSASASVFSSLPPARPQSST